MFALCSAVALLAQLACDGGWVDGSWTGNAEYDIVFAGSEQECFDIATAAHPDVTYLTWQAPYQACMQHGPSYIPSFKLVTNYRACTIVTLPPSPSPSSPSPP